MYIQQLICRRTAAGACGPVALCVWLGEQRYSGRAQCTVHLRASEQQCSAVFCVHQYVNYALSWAQDQERRLASSFHSTAVPQKSCLSC